MAIELSKLDGELLNMYLVDALQDAQRQQQNPIPKIVELVQMEESELLTVLHGFKVVVTNRMKKQIEALQDNVQRAEGELRRLQMEPVQ